MILSGPNRLNALVNKLNKARYGNSGVKGFSIQKRWVYLSSAAGLLTVQAGQHPCGVHGSAACTDLINMEPDSRTFEIISNINGDSGESNHNHNT